MENIASTNQFPFGNLSNNALTPFFLDGVKWPTVTNYLYSNLLTIPIYRRLMQFSPILGSNIKNIQSTIDEQIRLKTIEKGRILTDDEKQTIEREERSDIDKRFQNLLANEEYQHLSEGLRIGYEALLANPDFRRALELTKNSSLVYVNENEPIFGVDSNGNGMNLVGKVLESVRAKLFNETKIRDEMQNQDDIEEVIYKTYIAHELLAYLVNHETVEIDEYHDLNAFDIQQKFNKSMAKLFTKAMKKNENFKQLYKRIKKNELSDEEIVREFYSRTHTGPRFQTMNIVLDLYRTSNAYPYILRNAPTEAILAHSKNLASYVENEFAVKDYVVRRDPDRNLVINSIILEEYFKYVVSKKFPELTKEVQDEAIREMRLSSNVSVEVFDALKTRIVRLYSRRNLPQELHSKIESKINKLEIVDSESKSSSDSIKQKLRAKSSSSSSNIEVVKQTVPASALDLFKPHPIAPDVQLPVQKIIRITTKSGDSFQILSPETTTNVAISSNMTFPSVGIFAYAHLSTATGTTIKDSVIQRGTSIVKINALFKENRIYSIESAKNLFQQLYRDTFDTLIRYFLEKSLQAKFTIPANHSLLTLTGKRSLNFPMISDDLIRKNTVEILTKIRTQLLETEKSIKEYDGGNITADPFVWKWIERNVVNFFNTVKLFNEATNDNRVIEPSRVDEILTNIYSSCITRNLTETFVPSKFVAFVQSLYKIPLSGRDYPKEILKLQTEMMNYRNIVFKIQTKYVNENQDFSDILFDPVRLDEFIQTSLPEPSERNPSKLAEIRMQRRELAVKLIKMTQEKYNLTPFDVIQRSEWQQKLRELFPPVKTAVKKTRKSKPVLDQNIQMQLREFANKQNEAYQQHYNLTSSQISAEQLNEFKNHYKSLQDQCNAIVQEQKQEINRQKEFYREMAVMLWKQISQLLAFKSLLDSTYEFKRLVVNSITAMSQQNSDCNLGLSISFPEADVNCIASAMLNILLRIRKITNKTVSVNDINLATTILLNRPVLVQVSYTLNPIEVLEDNDELVVNETDEEKIVADDFLPEEEEEEVDFDDFEEDEANKKEDNAYDMNERDTDSDVGDMAEDDDFERGITFEFSDRNRKDIELCRIIIQSINGEAVLNEDALVYQFASAIQKILKAKSSTKWNRINYFAS